jgi:hypothetical protein
VQARVTTRPKIVCLCGAARFQEQFQTSYLQETLAGHIVLSIALAPGGEDSLLAGLATQEKEKLKARFDALHRHKIDLADEILILNVGGYIGQSTADELVYARKQGKRVRFLERLE